MVKAHSLLYAIFICLIISVLCGALLYMASLYTRLNEYYATHEELYIHNQSLVNFALSHHDTEEQMPDEDNGIGSSYTIKQYGLFPVLTAHSYFKNDTVSSTHFVGDTRPVNAIYVTNFGIPLAYSGMVTLSGEKKLPHTYVKSIHINNEESNLTMKGNLSLSDGRLPQLAEDIKRVLSHSSGVRNTFDELPRKDSLFYNSFLRPTNKIMVESNRLSGITVKGNVILWSADSITVDSSANLEDVILMAPAVYIKDGFRGSVQVFARSKIVIGEHVQLTYPSSLCLYNTSLQNGQIQIKSHASIYGAIVLAGNDVENIKKNVVTIEKDCLLNCDIYCSGTLAVKSDILGSVYTNKFQHTTQSSVYDNCIANIMISPVQRPEGFFATPLFGNTAFYGVSKRVL